jgi:hypothetical protein
VATHGQRSSGGPQVQMRRHSAGKNKETEKQAGCSPIDSSETPNYDTRNQYQKAQNSTPEMNHHDFLIRKVMRHFEPQLVQIFITVIRCSNYDSRPLALSRQLAVSTPLLVLRKTTRILYKYLFPPFSG